MATHTITNSESKVGVKVSDWLRIGVVTALASIISVLVVQALALAIWPEIALFKPLESYPRSALFTLVPVIGATLIFAWLAKISEQPVKRFVTISLIFLLLSFIPDYALPVEHKTLLASSVAAFMHLVAGVVTVTILVTSFRKLAAK